ncbi:MAG TPA: carboxypeptidase-like regulatory domain-containing protein [Caulifigura sp.]|nr:carboxypeptidase-like regulatory domain-containing protein [Caulifigura sp.]
MPWLLALSCAACSSEDPWKKGRPPVYPTSGSVVVDGRPMQGVTVMFQPVDEATGKPGTAITDSNGNFSAQTFDPGDGLTEGTHRVALRKTVMLDKQGNEVLEIREPGDVKETHLIPKKYQEFKTSGIEVQIKPEGANELKAFEVSTK